MMRALILLAGFIGSLQAQTQGPLVNEVVPKALYLEAGGKQITCILRGTNLHLLKQVQMKKQGQPVGAIYTQLGPASDNRRTLSFMASPQCVPGNEYQVVGITVEGAVMALPVPLTVVRAGDPKATLPDTATLEERTQIQEGNRIVVSQALAPVVTGTIPAPLVIAPQAETQKILIQGRNLKSITEVRIRKSETSARYKGAQGILPFRTVDGAIEVEILTGTTVAPGSRFTVDLMVKKYLAASVLMTVDYPASKQEKEALEPTPEPNVIQLTPNPAQTN
jgi:hypothetical protein